MERTPLFPPQEMQEMVAAESQLDLSVSPYQQRVFDALKPYAEDPNKLFPPGVSQEVVVLLFFYCSRKASDVGCN